MDRRYARLILNIVIPAVEILLVCLLGAKLLKFFMPFVIGWIIAMIANPLVRFLESRVKIVRKHSSVLIVVAVLALIIGLSYFLVSRLILQAVELAKDLPVLYDALSADLQEISVRFASLFPDCRSRCRQTGRSWLEASAMRPVWLCRKSPLRL